MKSAPKNPSRKPAPAKSPAPKRSAPKPAPRKSARPARSAKKKPRTWTRWLLHGISLALAVYGVIRVLGYYYNEQQHARLDPIARHPATAAARVVESSGRKSRRVHYVFVYKGIVYDTWQSDYNAAFQPRHCYEVRLDSTNPMRSFLVEGKELPGE